MNEIKQLLKEYQSATNNSEKVALATIVRVHGSSYRKVGAKMLITERGYISGMLSGGCLERDLIRKAQIAMQTGIGKLVCYDSRLDIQDECPFDALTPFEASTRDATVEYHELENAEIHESPTMGCEGIIEIYINPFPQKHIQILQAVYQDFIERKFMQSLPDQSVFVDQVHPPVHLVIFGGGPDAMTMARFAYELGWHTTLLDSRSSFPRVQLNPNSISSKILDDHHVCGLFELPKHIPKGNAFAAMVMTHHYDHDAYILRLLNKIQPRYVGILGPRHRTLRILNELNNEAKVGLRGSDAPLDFSKFHFPMGLDIGGETPQSIALSALSEAHAVLHHREGRFLKLRQGSIHRTEEDSAVQGEENYPRTEGRSPPQLDDSYSSQLIERLMSAHSEC